MSSPTLFQNIAGDPLNFWRGQALDLRKVRDFANLSNKDISRIAGVAPTSVRFDDKVPVEVREHMENIANVCNLVFEFFQDDVKTKLWLQTPNPMLGNTSPKDMIRVGRYKKLMQFVSDALREGAGTHGEAPQEKARA
ncbi:MAG: antitoxin Xre/MbcA/ParS toxin-binding domain-containing protein [Steroidobacteraceae bacterium]